MSDSRSNAGEMETRPGGEQESDVDDGDAPETGPIPDEQNEEEIESLPLDQVFEILKNNRRRLVLKYLKERDEPVSMSDLSERIAAWENDKGVEELTSDERKRVYVGLYQCHLPKMDGMDIVEFNKPRGIIELDANAGLFDSYLESEERDDPPWHRYYASLSLGSALLLGLAVAIGTVTAIPAAEIALVTVIAAFSTCSIFHLRYERETEKDAETSPLGRPGETAG